MNKKKTPFEARGEVRAVEFFRDDPERALAGSRLSSAEADASADRSLAIMNLASEEPGRFLELVSYLPHAIQDIFYQYYLLGRTQEQIGRLIGVSHQADVSHALKIGVEALCVIIAYGNPPHCQPGTEMARAYQAMLEFKTKSQDREELHERTHRRLGEFEINANDAELVMETFAASWSVFGPRSAGS